MNIGMVEIIAGRRLRHERTPPRCGGGERSGWRGIAEEPWPGPGRLCDLADVALESARVRMTEDADIELIAAQMAELTHVVEDMGKQLHRLVDASVTAQTRADVQQERIEIAARELAEVSDRLQAAANALRQSV
jgi:hypothetical protein